MEETNHKPKKMGVLKFLKEIRDNNVENIRKLHLEQGDLFKVASPIINVHFVANGDCLKYVLSNPQIYYRPQETDRMVKLLGADGILNTNDYEIWKRDRTLFSPLFAGEKLRSYTNSWVEALSKTFDRWGEYADKKILLNLHDESTFLVLEMLMRAIFSDVKLDFKSVNDVLLKTGKIGHKYINSMFKFMWKIPTPYRAELRVYKAQFLGIADKIIEHCLAVPEENLVNVLAKACGYDGTLTPELRKILQGEILIFLVGGHETSASILSWTLIYLSLYPLVAEKIREEVQSVVGDRLPTYEDTHSLPYVKAVLSEVLRLQPSFRNLVREAAMDDSIGSYQIKKGDFVMIPGFYLNRLTQYWENPEGFDPSRFLKPLSEESKSVYIPFGFGPRNCIGQHLFMLEGTLALVMITQRFKLDLVNPQFTFEHDPYLLHRPRVDTMMLVRRITPGGQQK